MRHAILFKKKIDRNKISSIMKRMTVKKGKHHEKFPSKI